MTVEVLISCMHQNDASIIKRTNIQSDVVVVNQCDTNKIEEFTFKNKHDQLCHAKFISTTERGLSRSRNMALRNASGDICLICDDDEVLADDYCKIISDTYRGNSKCSFIAFNLNDRYRIFPSKKKKIGYVRALKIASWQITFKREDILAKGIQFDEEMGAGVTMGGSEENKFLIDCIKSRLFGIYSPQIIGTVSQIASTWGVDESNYPKYFRDRGQAYFKLMGRALGSLYIIYSSIKKNKQYRKYCSFHESLRLQFKGLNAR